MKEIKTFAIEEFFDEMFGENIIFSETPVRLEKVALPPEMFKNSTAPVRRYAVALDDFLPPEAIRRFDRRLKRIGEKRDFDFTGTIGNSNLVVDIMPKTKGNTVIGFQLTEMIISKAIGIAGISSVTPLLFALSAIMFTKDIEDKEMGKTVDMVLDTIDRELNPAALEDMIQDVLGAIADETDIVYSELVVATDSETGEEITAFPGITKRQETTDVQN